MLERLKIKRFKSTQDEELDFGQVNLFIGGNGAGKSNLLEAIGMVSACLGRSVADSDIAAKGVRSTPAELMKSAFKDEHLPETFELGATFTGKVQYKAVLGSSENHPYLQLVEESACVNGTSVFEREDDAFRSKDFSIDRLDRDRGAWDQVKIASDAPEAMENAFSEFAGYLIYTPQTEVLRSKEGEYTDVQPIGLHGEGLAEAVASFQKVIEYYRRKEEEEGSGGVELKLVQACRDLLLIPGWVERANTERGKRSQTSREVAEKSGVMIQLIDRFMREDLNRMSAHDSGEGTLFLLFMAVVLVHPRAPRVLALDNADRALNPNIARKFMEQIIDTVHESNHNDAEIGARQVFVTSHNPTALDAFDLFNEEERVFVVSRDDLGHTVAKRLVPPSDMVREDWMLVANGRNLSQMWIEGDIPDVLGKLQ